MSYGFCTIPVGTNDKYQPIPLNEPSQYTLPIHSESIITGKGYWLECVCSTDADVTLDVSVMANVPWDTGDSISKGWPTINDEDLWTPCPDIQSFSLTAGVIHREISTESLKSYRRIRVTINPKTPKHEIAKNIGYAAFRLELSIT